MPGRKPKIVDFGQEGVGVGQVLAHGLRVDIDVCERRIVLPLLALVRQHHVYGGRGRLCLRGKSSAPAKNVRPLTYSLAEYAFSDEGHRLPDAATGRPAGRGRRGRRERGRAKTSRRTTAVGPRLRYDDRPGFPIMS